MHQISKIVYTILSKIGEYLINGAESLITTLECNGVDVCFANPGTSEMHFVAALDNSPGIRGVLGLFEGVVTGAADGYARLADKPAATLLHLGPGMANGLSSMHNAIKARSPMVNIIGDHATYHRDLNAPLTSDIEGAARPFSDWVKTSKSATSIAQDTAKAIGFSSPGRVASLILPADVAWNKVKEPIGFPRAIVPPPVQFESEVIDEAAKVLRKAGGRTALLLGGRALRTEQLAIATQIAQGTGATLLAETFSARIQRGAGRYSVTRVPYPVADSVKLLDQFDSIILIDAKEPVAFFAYPNKPSKLTRPETCFYVVSPQEADSLTALESLRSAVFSTTHLAPRIRPLELKTFGMPSGKITPEKLAAWLAVAIPENSILVDESITTGRHFFAHTQSSQPHEYLGGTGGSIGWALPVSTGAAIACPSQKVITLESDGSGMYMPQALWTQARESLDVVTIVLANRRYQILRNEMANVGVPEFGEKASALLDIDNPVINWASLSASLGVPAQSVDTIEGLTKAFQGALEEPGPRLIEAVL